MTIDMDFFYNHSEHTEVDAKLLMAIATVESALDPNTARYEPGWIYHTDVTEWAKKVRVTRDTEKVLQSISWGLMQVMGTVAREMGFDNHLSQLTNPTLNILIAIRKLEQLYRRYDWTEDVVSAYNQGSARKKNEHEYRNQHYVDKVMSEYYALK